MKWIEVAKNLPLGHNTRTDCPQCGQGTSTNAAICNHNAKFYSISCFACPFNEYESKGVQTLEERQRLKELDNDAIRQSQSRTISLPRDTTYEPTEFSREARTWLFAGGLTPSTWKRYSIGYSPSLKRVVLPVFDDNSNLTWYQLRAIHEGQRPKYIQPSADKSNIRFTAGATKVRKRLIVVEDIMSAIRVAGAGYTQQPRTLGQNLAHLRRHIVEVMAKLLSGMMETKQENLVLATIRRSVGLITDVNIVRTEEDPKCYSNKQIKETLQ